MAGSYPTEAFLNGISDFWLRFFKDSGVLQTLYSGSLARIGDNYKRLLTSFNMLSLANMPVHEELPWYTLYINYPDVIYVPGLTSDDDRWLWPLPETVRKVYLLHNIPINPTASVEADFDFDVIEDDRELLAGYNIANNRVPLTGYFLAFYKDPFKWGYIRGENGGYRWYPIPGFATTGVTYSGNFRVIANDDVDFDTLFAGVDDDKYLFVYYSDNTEERSLILDYSGSELVLDPREPINSSKTILRANVGITGPTYDDLAEAIQISYANVNVNATVLSAWAPIAYVDNNNMFNMYGASFSYEPVASSETYRNFLLAHWKLFTTGTTLPALEAVLNVLCSYEVFRLGETTEPVEELVSITIPQGEVGEVEVVTNLSSYTYAYGTPIKADIVFGAPEVNGYARDGSLTIFSDTELEISLYGLGVRDGDELRIFDDVDPLVYTSYSIVYATDAYVKIDPAAPLSDAYLNSDLNWEIWNADGLVILGVTGRKAYDFVVDYTVLAFHAITDVFTVVDEVSSPYWWYGTTIPQPLTPDLALARRQVETTRYENVIGNPSLLRIGDIGYIVGRSDDTTLDFTEGYRYLIDFTQDFIALGIAEGYKLVIHNGGTQTVDIGTVGRHFLKIPDYDAFASPYPGITIFDMVDDYSDAYPNTVTYDVKSPDLLTNYLTIDTGELWPRPGKRHTIAYMLMDRYLKHNMFSVSFDASNDNVLQNLETITDLILEAKPAHTYPYLEPGGAFVDVFPSPTEEEIDITAAIAPSDQASALLNLWVIGGRPLMNFEDAAEDQDFVDFVGVQRGYKLEVLNYDGLGANLVSTIDGISVLERANNPGVYKNRLFLTSSYPSVSFDSKAFTIYTASLMTAVYISAGASGRMRGAIGDPEWIIGGADPELNVHELVRTTDEIDNEYISFVPLVQGDSPQGIPSGPPDDTALVNLASIVITTRYEEGPPGELVYDDIGVTLSSDKHLMLMNEWVIQVTTAPAPP